ncbi:MAG: hypothetical protein QOK40_3557 [Miltoncostaeaceae bacterium]|jgi:hypothetical protein|nr:hypothetical protein [Miltoncostaeaceae bacterium]
MTTKADFNAEEWEAVVRGPLSAGVLVATAERGGTFRESLSMAQAYTEARKSRGKGTLLDEIVSSAPALEPPAERSLEALREQSRSQLQQAVELLAGKADEGELDEYRAFVLDVAERVAAAHKEGGFLGIGGTRVTDAERRAIEEVRQALGAAS